MRDGCLLTNQLSQSGDAGLLSGARPCQRERMISVVIPTLNAEESLARTLTCLVPAAVDGLVREVVVVDGGSTDNTLVIADSAGVEIVEADGGRGAQLKAGAARARYPWLLFLRPGAELEPSWAREADQFMERVDDGRLSPRGATFRFKLDDFGMAPRTIEALVSLRARLLKLPYGGQGLLIPRRLYDEVGGYRPLPLMEDADIARRLGGRRLFPLGSRVMTSAARYRRDGYLSRIARHQMCLMLYLLRVPPATIAGLFGLRRAALPEAEIRGANAR